MVVVIDCAFHFRLLRSRRGLKNEVRIVLSQELLKMATEQQIPIDIHYNKLLGEAS